MAFCKFCGNEIPEGSQCTCAESQAAPAPAETTPVTAEAAAKPSNKAAIVLVCGLVILLIIIISLVSAIAGGGYKKPVNDFEKALNKTDGELLAECMYTDDMIKDLSKTELSILDTTLEWLEETCEEELGDDIKYSIKIKDKEKIDKKELKELEDDYDDKDVKITKGYVVEAEIKIKGDDDKIEEKIEITVVKIKGEGWKLSPDSALGAL